MTPIERAAYAWWKNRRPLVYSEAEHLRNPTVNTCTDGEARLARAVARMRKERKKR